MSTPRWIKLIAVTVGMTVLAHAIVTIGFMLAGGLDPAHNLGMSDEVFVALALGFGGALMAPFVARWHGLHGRNIIVVTALTVAATEIAYVGHLAARSHDSFNILLLLGVQAAATVIAVALHSRSSAKGLPEPVGVAADDQR